MIRVLILEDLKSSREAISAMVSEISQEIAVYPAGTTTEAEEVLFSDEIMDLFMLDINLNPDEQENTEGLAFARKIRNTRGYEFTPVVMITSIAALEMSAFREVHCYQYIVKPFFRQDVEQVVRRVLIGAKEEPEPYIVVKKEGINYNIKLKDIVFIKAIPRGICLYLRQEQLAVPYLSIKQLRDRLPEEEFIQCHRMYVIHKAYVDYVDPVNQVLRMTGYDDPIEIGVTYKADIRRRFHE